MIMYTILQHLDCMMMKKKFNEFMNRVAKKQEITYPHLLNINNPYRDYKVNAFFLLLRKNVYLIA